MTSINMADGEPETPPSKKLKVEEKINNVSPNTFTPLSTLSGFQMTKLLSENTQEKRVCVQGNFENGDPSVLIIEKIPFTEDSLKKLFSDSTQMKILFQNDVYSSYDGFPSPDISGIKVTVIRPATSKHFEKYTSVPLHLIYESPEDYTDITLPYVEAQKLSQQWVYNILEHKSEHERIIYEDPDPENGFILLPDMKWNEKDIKNLYIVAICHDRTISSLRQLASKHLALLKNIRDKGVEKIQEKYGLTRHQLRIYLHYQPSYYHLHVHFTALTFDAPGSRVERAHLLDTVISNLELVSDYYQRVTLSFPVPVNSALHQKYKAADKIQIVENQDSSQDVITIA